MPNKPTIECFFHRDQLSFRPRYEWALGQRIAHPEKTERADQILSALESEPGRYEVRTPGRRPLAEIQEQHRPELLALYETATSLEEDETYYPSAFMHRRGLAVDPRNINHVGHFCFDSGTPLDARAWFAATWSAGCAVAAAESVRDEEVRMAYSLSRPPGHHAAEDLFGGYCYINNSGLAARALGRGGARVAILDIDVHHGNGTQSLFWEDPNVFTVSIHGDPRSTFPFFTGFASEKGAGAGEGRNLNVPLPVETDGQEYLRVLQDIVLPRILAFEPKYLVVAAGVDAYELDPVGNFCLSTEDFFRVGERLGAAGLPLCVVQEGGYHTPDIGKNVVALLDGMREGCFRLGGHA